MDEKIRLEDCVAVVTGAGGGIGKEISLRLAAEGATLIAADISSSNAQSVAQEIVATGGFAEGFGADVTKSGEINAMVGEVCKKYGKIDILVNNAGGSAGLLNKLSPFNETTEEIWKWVIDLNLNGTMICTHAVINEMIKRRRGRIINISSIAAKVGILHRSDYAAAKAGIIAFSKTLAMEVGCYNINVNCISPGAITPHEGVLPTEGTYLGRWGKPADIAAITAFLASDEANFITGANFTVDGGRVLGPKADFNKEK